MKRTRAVSAESQQPAPTQQSRSVVRSQRAWAAMLALCVLVPGHMFNWWLERGLIVVGLGILGVQIARDRLPRSVIHSWVLVTAPLMCSQVFYTVGYLTAILVRGTPTGGSDVFELLRFPITALYVLWYFSARRWAPRELLQRVLVLSLCWSLLVAFCYYVDVPILSPLFKLIIYADAKTWRIAGTLSMRLSAPFENPNFLGYFLDGVLCYAIFDWDGKGRLAVSVGCIVLLILTGSRTSWFVAAFVFAFWLVSSVVRARVAPSVRTTLQRLRFFVPLVLILGVGLVGSGSWLIGNPRVRSLMGGGSILTLASVAVRLEMTVYALKMFASSPWVGWGPGKYLFEMNIDNHWALWAARMGIIGLGALLVSYLLFVMSAVKHAWLRAKDLAGPLCYVFVIGIFLMTGDYLGNFRLLFITLVMFSLYGAARTTSHLDRSGSYTAHASHAGNAADEPEEPGVSANHVLREGG